VASRSILVAAAAGDPFVSELVRFLRSEECDVLLAHDARGALRAARSRRPVLVVLDAVLGGGDGLSLCRQLKGDPSTCDIPVFCFSTLMVRDRCEEVGADGFMLKPTEQETLLHRIREVLQSQVKQFPRHAPRGRGSSPA